MRIARTLSLYVMRETLLYCGLAFLILTLVLLTQNLLRRLDELFLIGMTLADVVIVIRCIVPIALSYSVPLAFLIGVILALRRMSSDGELVALRASGVGPIQLLMPCLVLGLGASLVSSHIVKDVEHESRRELVQLFKRVAARGAIIEPDKFRHLGRHLIFVEERGRDGSLVGVMIYDQGAGDRSYRVFASHGRFFFDEATSEIQLDLEDGVVHLDPSRRDATRYERIGFDSFSYRIDVGFLIGMDFGPVRPKQMTLSELEAVIARGEAGDPLRELDQRDPVEYALEVHRRRAQPLAPLLFAGFGVPIALASEHRGRNIGLLLVLLAAFGYYALGSLMTSVAASGLLPPALAQWFPNLVFLLVGGVLTAHARTRIPA